MSDTGFFHGMMASTQIRFLPDANNEIYRL